MRFRSISILAPVTAFVFVPVLLAQTPARPDFTGTWDHPGAAGAVPTGPGATAIREEGIPRQDFSTEEPPMQDWAEAKYRQARQGVTSLYTSGGDEFDPRTVASRTGCRASIRRRVRSRSSRMPA